MHIKFYQLSAGTARKIILIISVINALWKKLPSVYKILNFNTLFLVDFNGFSSACKAKHAPCGDPFEQGDFEANWVHVWDRGAGGWVVQRASEHHPKWAEFIQRKQFILSFMPHSLTFNIHYCAWLFIVYLFLCLMMTNSSCEYLCTDNTSLTSRKREQQKQNQNKSKTKIAVQMSDMVVYCQSIKKKTFGM